MKKIEIEIDDDKLNTAARYFELLSPFPLETCLKEIKETVRKKAAQSAELALTQLCRELESEAIEKDKILSRFEEKATAILQEIEVEKSKKTV